jgi:hypothetical protein
MGAAIKSTTVFQWLLNKAMKLNPIGIIIVAVTALIAGFAALGSPLKMITKLFGEQTEAVQSAADAQRDLTKSIEKTDAAIEKINAKRNKKQAQRMEQMIADGATEKELHNERLNVIKKEQKARKGQIEIERQMLSLLRANKSKAVAEGETELAEEIREQIIAKKKSFEKLKELQTNYHHDLSIENKDARAKEKAAEETAYNERVGKYKEFLSRKKAAEDTHLAVLREVEAHKLSLIEDQFIREQAVIENNFKIKREDLLANFAGTEEDKAALKLIYDEQEQVALDDLHARRLADAEAKTAEMQLATKPQEGADGELSTRDIVALDKENLKEQMMFDIKEKWNQKAEEMRDISESKAFKRTEAGLANASSALNSLDELNNALTDAAVAKAGDNEAAAEAARKKGFERSKKLQLTMAVITGIQGVMAAFTAGSSMGPAGVVMGPLMGALAAVTAGINIAKISKMKYQGGGGGGKPATGPATPPSVPSFNIAGNSTENQLAQSLGGQEQQPIKAMVVSTEVTTAQSLDRNKIETASL